jgi:XTP/dITP diphosphohydrolase
MKESKIKAFERLLIIMDELREKCPWDQKQTLASLRHLTIEETYELGDAILENDLEGLKGEIGDLMLHMVFYSKIADEMGAFDIEDVINYLCDKLIRRHPHIYGDVKVQDEAEVKANWEKIKLQEGKKSILEGVPNSLPALVKAFRIQEKAKQVGFEWENKEQVFEKVEEELNELQDEIYSSEYSNSKVEEEFGDLLFSLINYARFLKIDPEMALEKTNKKFIQRFRFIEENATKDLSYMTLEEMDELWNKAKIKNS